MQIDWLTVAAQAVNFLILVFLLKKFLYGPVIAAMDRREARIAARLSEAAEREALAGRAEKDYEGRLRELERERAAMLDDARGQADAERERLFAAAREEVARTEDRWRDELDRERQALRQSLRQEIALSALAIARRSLSDLADAKLESRVVDVFLQRLAALEPERRTAFTEGQGPATVATGFPLNDGDRARIVAALREFAGDALEAVFETDPDLVCGIEVDRAGRRIGWSVADQLDEFEEALLRRLSDLSERGGAAPAGASA